jgi:hypothetical protein
VQEVTYIGERLLTLAPGGFPDVQDGDSVNRRLAQAAGIRWRLRGIERNRGASQVFRTGIIAVRRSLRAEDNVGYLASDPLVGKQGTEFEGGAADVEVGEPDGYERAVPAPLVRIKLRGGTGPAFHIVLTQDRSCLRGQLFVLLENLHPARIPSRVILSSLL